MRKPFAVQTLVDGQLRWRRPGTNEVVTLADLFADLEKQPAAAVLPTNSVKNEQSVEDAGGAPNTTADAVPEQALGHLDNVDADEKKEDEDDDPAADPPCHQAGSSHKSTRKSTYAFARGIIIGRHFRPCRNRQGHPCKPAAEFKGRGKRCAYCKDVLKKRCKWGDAWLDHNKVRKYEDCLGDGMTEEEADVAVWGGPRTILGGKLDKLDKKDYKIPTSGPAWHATGCCLSNLKDATATVRRVLADEMSKNNVIMGADALETVSMRIVRAIGACSKGTSVGHAVV